MFKAPGGKIIFCTHRLLTPVAKYLNAEEGRLQWLQARNEKTRNEHTQTHTKIISLDTVREIVFHIEPLALTHFGSIHPWTKFLMCGQILETCKCGAIHLHSAMAMAMSWLCHGYVTLLHWFHVSFDSDRRLIGHIL